MKIKPTHEQLRKVLARLGYSPSTLESKHVVFQNPSHHLMIILPGLPDHEPARPVDLLSVRKTLANDGVVREEDFDALFRIQKGDRLIWTEPSTGHKLRVTAAAGESDGFVVIKQHGVFSPCPVRQLRREDEVPSHEVGN